MFSKYLYPLGELPAGETLKRALSDGERAGAFTKNKPTYG